MQFKNMITIYRIKKGWSTRILADFVDVSHTTIQCWESGKYDIPLKKVEQIADILGIVYVVGNNKQTNGEKPGTQIAYNTITRR